MSQPSVDARTAAIVGVAAGLLGGTFGVGGGLIIVPGLVSFAGMERRLAHGTSLAATLPIACASLLTYIATGNVDWPLALFLAIGAIGGAYLGTHLLQIIPKRALTILFIAVVVATAFRLLLTDTAGGRSDLTALMAVGLVVIGFITGTLAGLLGIGGGIIMVPAMVVLLDELPVVAKGTSVAVIVPTAIMGTLRNRKKSNADLRVAAIVGGFGVASAVVGGLIANQLSTQASNIMFAALLVFVAITQVLSLRAESRAAAAASSR
ncbi:MAG: sulfite exporter TauE/SafE family protein [Actinomycetota bacterium]